jgi:hypothetical protein
MPTKETLELINTIATCVSAVGILFVWWQITLHRKQLREDHERSRRENALQMMLEWAKKMEQGTNIVTRFVDSLDKHQARRLAGEKSFTVGTDRLEYLQSLASGTGLLEDQVFKRTNGTIRVDSNLRLCRKSTSSELFEHAGNCLNRLEGQHCRSRNFEERISVFIQSPKRRLHAREVSPSVWRSQLLSLHHKIR